MMLACKLSIFLLIALLLYSHYYYSDFDETGGSQTQLTAKRWMRANANYSKIIMGFIGYRIVL